MRRLAAVLFLLAAIPALAADLHKPEWRGAALSTHQEWTFDIPPPHYPKTIGPDTHRQRPTRSDNPFAAGIDDLYFGARGLLPPKMEWLPAFSQASGVWRVARVQWGDIGPWGFLSFAIANADRKDLVKEIRVQVTSQDVTGPPQLMLQERQPPPKYWARIQPANVAVHPNMLPGG